MTPDRGEAGADVGSVAGPEPGAGPDPSGGAAGVEVAAPHRTFRSVAGPLVLLRLAGQGLEFGGFVLLARNLGAATFGLLSVPFLIARYAGLIADWGASVRGPRDVAAESPPAAIRALVVRRTQVSTLLFVAFVGLAIALGHPAVAPLGVTILARGMARDWLSLGRERGMRAGIPSASQGTLVFVGALVGSTLLRASLAIAAAYAVAGLLSILLNRLPRAEGRAIPTPVDGWLLLATLAVQVYLTSDTVLLAWLVSEREAGIYAAVYRLPNAWMTLFGLIALSLLPGMTRRVAGDPSMVHHLQRRARHLGGLAFGAVLLTVPFAYLFVPVLFGADYTAGQVPLVLLMLAVGLYVATVALEPLYLAIGSDRSYALAAMTAAVFNIVANVIVIPRAGMVGAASVTLGSQAIFSAFLAIATHLEARRLTGATA